MSELFEDDDDDIEQSIDTTVELEDEEELSDDEYQPSPSEARRRLETMLAEKKLRDELEDFFDDFEE